MNRKLLAQLTDLGISNADSFELYHDRVRDREDVNVYKCNRSGVILLDYEPANVEQTYHEKAGFEYWSQDWNKGVKEILPGKQNFSPDDVRRAKALSEIVKNRTVLDFGTGMGGFLRQIEAEAREVHGTELQPTPRAYLNELGIRCDDSIESLPDEYYDLITLFHVVEHLEEPVEILRQLSAKLKPGGRMVIEVPHARDVLLTVYQSEAFKKFTLWSEHLLLHTRESLRRFIQAAGLEVQSISGIQRYTVSNHLHWLSREKPGGHLNWAFLNSPDLEQAYESVLAKNDLTDTLFAYCQKG